MLVLYSQNYGGNLHQTVTTLNLNGRAEHVLTMDSSGHSTIVVFKISKKLRAVWWAEDNRIGEPR